jgi:hypothetical protein
MAVADKIGVCLPIQDTTGPCRFPDKVQAAMRFLGLDMIRTRAPQQGVDSWRNYKAVAAYGFRFVFTHRVNRDPAAEVVDLTEFNRLFPGQIIGYEGPNEPDLNPVTFAGITDQRRVGYSWTGRAALALMAAQRTELRKVPALNAVKLVAFNDWMQAEQKPYSSLANSHIYPRNGVLIDRLAAYDALVATHGRGQGMITEWGYHNVIGASQTAPGISESDAARNYIADISVILTRPTISQAFIYNGVDGYGGGEFNRFGLFRSDWTPKPAATAISKLRQ